MSDTFRSLVGQELLAMKRLTRLFRAERHGSFERRRADIVRALINRRGDCIGKLFRLDAERRRSAVPANAELNQAAVALAQEVNTARSYAGAAADRLHAEIKTLRGEGALSGVTGLSTGKILGRG
jgi:hypothetical protein